MDHQSVIEKVRQGYKEEFRHLIRECNQSLYRTALVILKNETDAQDAMQAAYLKAYLNLSSFRGDSSFQTWITRILINECKMMLRNKKQTTAMEEEEFVNTPSVNESVMDTLYEQQLQQLLEQAVMGLPEKYRLVYVIREVNEMSTQRTAEVLGLTEENVKVRLHRAKTLMRENLLKQVSVNELFPFGGKRCEVLTQNVMKAIGRINAEKFRTV